MRCIVSPQAISSIEAQVNKRIAEYITLSGASDANLVQIKASIIREGLAELMSKADKSTFEESDMDGIHDAIDAENIKNPRVDMMSKEDRVLFLRNHPAIAARMFHLKQECVWECLIINSKSQPLGKVVDFWIRVEFQKRGTAHTHSMVAIEKNQNTDLDLDETSISSENIIERNKVIKLVKETVTCNLTPRVWNSIQKDKTGIPLKPADSLLDEDVWEDTYVKSEKEYEWKPHKHYFDDLKDPRRLRFDEKLDYSMLPNGDFASTTVQLRYRQLQIANQLHECCFTCWKYNKFGDKSCRSHFPVQADPRDGLDGLLTCNLGDSWQNECTIVKDRDKKNRVRARVLPERNNAHLNGSYKNVLLFCAHGGNVDCKYISNAFGAGLYAADYASKNEAADKKTIRNLWGKKMASAALLSGNPTDQQQLKYVGQAIAASNKVGAVQACYILLNQPLVKSSRVVESVNPLLREHVNRKIQLPNSKITKSVVLVDDENEEEEDVDEGSDQDEPLKSNDTVLTNGISSHLGRRDAFEQLTQRQYTLYGCCEVTFFSMLTYYTFSISKRKKLQTEDIPYLVIDPETGSLSCRDLPKLISLVVGKYLFCPLKRPKVINMSPYIAINNRDEQSAFATLLLHTSWPRTSSDNGEVLLTGESILCKPSAVIRLQTLVCTLKPYLLRSLQYQERADVLLTNNGRPLADGVHDISEDIHGESIYYGDMDEASYAPVTKPADISLQEGNSFMEFISSNDEQYYKQFIKTSFAQWKYEDAIKNTLQPFESTILNRLNTRIVPVDKYNERLCKHEDTVSNVLNSGQKIAYSKVSTYLYICHKYLNICICQ